jgi:competence protein ComEC
VLGPFLLKLKVMLKVVVPILFLVLGLTFFVTLSEDKVVFLDVGQGDSILMQEGTVQVLIDGGPGRKVLERLGEEMPWWDRRIEVVILTHPEADHITGLLHVLDRYEVGLVLFPEVVHSSQLQEKWLDEVSASGADWRFAESGQRVEAGDMVLSILGPFESEGMEAAVRASLNNVSVVTRVDYGELSFLLTGDVERRVENMLVQNTNSDLLDVDVLKAGHHGSNTSTYEYIINATTPYAAVISAGADNKFGHPHPEVLSRLGDIPVWRTDQEGSVKFVRLNDGWVRM